MTAKRFTSINEIPKKMRRIGEGVLSLEQAETLLSEAQEAADNSDKPFSICYGEARDEFAKKHHLDMGFWTAIDVESVAPGS